MALFPVVADLLLLLFRLVVKRVLQRGLWPVVVDLHLSIFQIV